MDKKADRDNRGRTGVRVRLAAAGLLLGGSTALRVAFAHLPTTSLAAFRRLTAQASKVVSSIVGVVPFALWDWIVAAFVLWTLVRLVRDLRSARSLAPVLSWVALFVALMGAPFVSWACNHYAPPLSGELGLEVGQYSTEDLSQATGSYLAYAAQLAPRVPRDGDGSLADQAFFELAQIAGASYGPLGEHYEVFAGSTAPVKALLLWGPPLLYSGHTGIYWAATSEAGVPLDCPPADLPFIMCHEAAHRLGIASEQEANFAAYLACERSDDVRLAYSGAYNAFAYCFNALSRYDPEAAVDLVETSAAGLGEGAMLVFADWQATREHYAAYEGPFERVGRTVNDGYLKSFGEDAGVRSYGLVVDYLIAWDKARA